MLVESDHLYISAASPTPSEKKIAGTVPVG
jgi:hypothetical protein